MKKVVFMIILAGFFASCTKDVFVDKNERIFQLEYDVLSLKEGDDDENESAGRIQGQITDQNGNPQQGVPVELEREDLNYQDSRTTDANGEFTFEDLDPSDYELRIQPNSEAEQVHLVTVP